jgi:formylglycine-generating enzyme required for sulfatase activity
MIACKRSVVFTLFILSIFILMPGISSAWEKVENVRFEQVDNDVHIYYDLSGDSEKYKVMVRGSSDGGRTYILPMKTVSGDVGKKVLPGSGKEIIWKALKDAGELEGDEFVFEVEAVSGPGKEFVNSIGIKFVYIQPGTFMMGSPSNEPKRDSDERQHEVTFTKGFYMGTTEVTQGQWKEVMGNDPSYFKNRGPDCPVEGVSWNDAQEFIKRLNKKEGTSKYRLPTEAEWEYACRAGSTTAFANGSITVTDCGHDPNLNEMGWYCGNSDNKTHHVAKKKPNALGLYDMHGNVCEWCQDWFGDYSSGHVTDPNGPSLGSNRMFRGGSWYNDASYCRSAFRSNYSPGDMSDYAGSRRSAIRFLNSPGSTRSGLGFRLAMSH